MEKSFTSEPIRDNTLSSNTYSGMFMYVSDENYIINNSFSDNTLYGVKIMKCDYNLFNNNTFSSNGWGMYLYGAVGDRCYFNEIHHNNFIDNTDQAYDDCFWDNSWNNIYPSGGNYWSDYTGVDNFSGPNQNIPGSDDIGDLPYDPTTGQGIQGSTNMDLFPLMTPVDRFPPVHSNEFPPSDSTTNDTSPIISIHITDADRYLIDTSAIELYVNGYRVFHELADVPSGYNVSYWHMSGFSPGEVVTCHIKAGDLSDNSMEFTWNFTVVSSFNIPLIDGWNLVSYPVIPFNTSIETVLGTISGSWDMVEYYDAVTQEWKSYATFKPPGLNDLWNLDHTMSFWVHTTEPCNLTVNGSPPPYTLHMLKAGWNLLGYPGTTLKTIAEALAGTGYDAVEGFNATAPYRLAPIADTYMMKPGEGYWVHVPADTVWVVDW